MPPPLLVHRHRREPLLVPACHDSLMRSHIDVALIASVTLSCGPGASQGQAEPTVDSTTSETTTSTATDSPGDEQRYPDVIEVEITGQDDGAFTFAVTISSPYDTPERYADAWRVLDPDGNELGIRVLTHDHAGEQPFTRQLRDVMIDPSIDRVRVEARDLRHGWGGDTLEVVVPHA